MAHRARSLWIASVACAASAHAQATQPATGTRPAAPPAPLAGGLYGMRSRGPVQLQRSNPPAAQAIPAGLAWLARHREPDGHWATGRFPPGEPAAGACDRAGEPGHDVFVTAVATLAFLGSGSTLAAGPHQEVVRKAVDWLLAQQSPRDGFIGPRAGRTAMFGHAAATVVLCEAYGLSRADDLAAPAQRALDALLAARHPGGVWSSDAQGGPSDSALLAWAVPALRSAKDFRLQVDSGVFDDVAHWLDRATDAKTGQLAWAPDDPAGATRRTRFPGTSDESLMAGGLLVRFLIGQDPRATPVMQAAAESLTRGADAPDDELLPYFATGALYQMGGSAWARWTKDRMQPLAARQHPEADGHAAGSWDPDGAFGAEGGRVTATGIRVLALEMYYRYARIVAGR